jgi:hypothetical protein
MEASTQSSSKKKVQKPTIHRKTDVDKFLGLIRPTIGTFSEEMHNNKQCS